MLLVLVRRLYHTLYSIHVFLVKILKQISLSKPPMAPQYPLPPRLSI